MEQDGDSAAPHEASHTEQETDGTAKVLEAISLCQSTLTSKIEEVKVDISLIRHDMTKLREREA